MESIERWAPIPGWEFRYEVSTEGQVRNIETGHVLRPAPNPAGYYTLQLCANGTCRTYRLHRLVLTAFTGPCPPGMEACHGDGDPSNNTLRNLRWDTPARNAADRVRHGTQPGVTKTRCVRGHEYTPENTGIRRDRGSRYCKACDRDRKRTPLAA